jgi:cold shock CspA family protein
MVLLLSPAQGQGLGGDGGNMRFTGRIKFFNQEKFWGVILPDGEGFGVFFHYQGTVNAEPQDLVQGAKVSYEIKQAHRGPKAINVRLQDGR